MGRTCTVCAHKDLDEINRLLLCSDSYRDIARQFGLSKDALARHKESHIPATLVKAEDIKEIAKAGNLLDDIQGLREKSTKILERAEQAGDLKTALLGIREARSCLELLAKVEGQLRDGPQITIINNPEWVELRTLVINALEPYPEAREAVVLAIRK